MVFSRAARLASRSLPRRSGRRTLVREPLAGRHQRLVGVQPTAAVLLARDHATRRIPAGRLAMVPVHVDESDDPYVHAHVRPRRGRLRGAGARRR